MSIISGYQKIKKMIKTGNGYQLLSHWTSSDTVEMNDGTTLEDRICNVDNISDQDKPISTAQQNALDQKADIVSPSLTGTPTSPTPSSGTNNTQIATTAFVQTAVSNGIAASDAMIVKGTIGTNGTITALPTTYQTGWTYRVVSNGTYAGQVCEIGDLLIALVDRDGSENQNTDWCVAQTNINGAITGITSEDAYIDCSQSGSVVTITHENVTRTNTASTAKPASGDTVTAVKAISSDEKGHVTGVETETITLPSLDATGLGLVSTKTSQGLSDIDKANARDNINAVNKAGDTITGTLVLSKTQDLSGTADNRPALIVGGLPTTAHIEVDNNEIQAKNNGTTPTDIYINSDGGNLSIGGHINGATKQCSYLDTKSVDNALLFDRSGGSKNPDSYYPMLAQYATSGIFWSLGVHGKDIVLCGVSKDRTVNGYEWRITVDSTTGAVSFPNSVSATSFSGNATSATNADKLDGYHGSVDATASTYVLRNASNYIYVNYINSNTVNNENASISQIITTNGTDNYYRKSSLQQLINSIGLGNYLPLSGGTMTGDLSFNGAHTISSSGPLTLKGINATVRLIYDGTARFEPSSNGGTTLGSSSLRWGQIYSTNSVISTSDRREKYDISYIGRNSEYDTQLSEEQLEKFMMGLLPCVYKLIDGTSGRPHHGLIAQDIETLMDEIGLSDHAAFIKSPKTKEVEIEKEIEEEIEDPDTGELKIEKKIVKETQLEEIPGEYIYSLRYEEFIADIIRFVQIQKKRIDNIEERLAASEKLNESLEKRLKALE